MREAVIVGGVRTPFAAAGKDLASKHPAELAAWNLREALFRLNLKGEEIDEIILGNVSTLPDSVNIARVAALTAGLPESVPACTVNRNCASSLESLALAATKIQSGAADLITAGGVESMSCTPLLFSKSFEKYLKSGAGGNRPARGPGGVGSGVRRKSGNSSRFKRLFSFRPSFLIPRNALREALTDPLTGLLMGESAELLAQEFAVLRSDQDRFACESHQKAFAARERLKEEIFPLFAGPQKQAIDQDGSVRLVTEARRARMGRAAPFFDKRNGTVTVFNSCPISDGAAVLVLMSAGKAAALGLRPLAFVRATAFVGLDPVRMGLGPVYAAARVLQKTGLRLKDMDLIEINEAFAAQVLACLKAFESASFCREKLALPGALGAVDRDRLNVNGGAIAIGHPVGATGARLTLTLALELTRRNKQWGLAALCIGGGQGGALILENAEAGS